MKAGWKRLVSLCLIVALSLGVFAVGASAADPEELRIPFKMELEEAVAGVEFQLEYTGDLTFEGLEKSEDLSSASLTPVVERNGVYHFGFFNADNQYVSGSGKLLDFGWLVFDYAGGDATITVKQARSVRVIDKDTTEAEVYELDLKITLPEDKEDAIEIWVNEKPVDPEEPDDDGDFSSESLKPNYKDWPFEDVAKSSWYYPSVKYVYEEGLMNGVSETKFAPLSSTTRGMIVTILHRHAGSPKTENDGANWWSEGRAWAMANEISDGTFMEREISRQEMATMLYRYMNFLGESTSDKGDLAKFPDGTEVSDWAEDALIWATGCGLVQGRTDGTLDPQGTATRAEVATMLMRFCEMLK